LLAFLCWQGYNKAIGLENAKEIWDTLRTAHEGNTMTKTTKMELLEGAGEVRHEERRATRDVQQAQVSSKPSAELCEYEMDGS
jgi:hypothetical protein